MSVFTPAPHGPCGKEEEAPASAPRAGLGPPSFPVTLGTPWAVKGTHLVPSSGTGTRKGPWLFYIYYFYYCYGVLWGICLHGISVVWAGSDPLPGCETCRKTKIWEFWCKVGCTEHVDISASQITSSFTGRLCKKAMNRIVRMCPVLYKTSWSL